LVQKVKIVRVERNALRYAVSGADCEFAWRSASTRLSSPLLASVRLPPHRAASFRLPNQPPHRLPNPFRYHLRLRNASLRPFGKGEATNPPHPTPHASAFANTEVKPSYNASRFLHGLQPPRLQHLSCSSLSNLCFISYHRMPEDQTEPL